MPENKQSCLLNISKTELKSSSLPLLLSNPAFSVLNIRFNNHSKDDKNQEMRLNFDTVFQFW